MATPGYPCRVSLLDAVVGENVLLLNYELQSQPTPYRSSHAIFVREYACQATPEKNEIPKMSRHRLSSLRTFDNSGMMIGAEVVEGSQLGTQIEQMLGSCAADYLHIHNAKLGCYAAFVRRAWKRPPQPTVTPFPALKIAVGMTDSYRNRPSRN